MKSFTYFDPESIDEVVCLLREKENCELIAGGTDLLVNIKQELSSPDVLISLRKIKEMKTIKKKTNGSLTIGAATPLSKVVMSPEVQNFQVAISTAAEKVGSKQIRNRGTIGGNICNASPAADTAPILLALEAKANIEGQDGKRVVPMTEFFLGPGNTALQRGEVLTDIVIPTEAANFQCAYLKLGVRKALEIPIVGVAVAVKTVDGKCKMARIALGAVAPTPMRSSKAERVIAGADLTENTEAIAEEAARLAMEECSPITDIRASKEYRRDMVGIIVKRAIKQILT